MAKRPANPSRDAPKRSLVKAISWRITGSIDTFILSWIFTGSPKIAVSIASVEVFTKIFLFYLHERLWARTRWGLKNNQDYSI
jgi:uncharacterized membrane protein